MKRNIEVGVDVNSRYLSMGSWKNRQHTRKPSREQGSQRDAKRNRCLGNAENRNIYKSAKGYKHRTYGTLCNRVDRFLGTG